MVIAGMGKRWVGAHIGELIARRRIGSGRIKDPSRREIRSRAQFESRVNDEVLSFNVRSCALDKGSYAESFYG